MALFTYSYRPRIHSFKNITDPRNKNLPKNRAKLVKKSIQKSLTDEQALFTSGLPRLGYSIIWTFSIHFVPYFLGFFRPETPELI